MRLMSGWLALTLGLLLSQSAAAATIPFTENFTTSDEGWRDVSNGITSLTHVAGGGRDGLGFVSTSFNFTGTATDDTVVLFRGPTSSSGGAFAGDWISENVGEFSAWVRHDSAVPLNFFARFAGPANFPGAVAVRFAPVIAIPGPSGWAQLSFSIESGNPAFVSFEGNTFETVFDNIGIVQVGVSVPAALANQNVDITVDLDTVGIVAGVVPEAGAVAQLGVALLALAGLRFRS